MAESSCRCYCSDPCCSNNKHKCPYLSFHDFPVDAEIRARWVRAIKRDEGPNFKILRGSTYVCSQHFTPEDLCTSAGERTRIKKGAMPSRFPWNDWGKGRTLAERAIRRVKEYHIWDGLVPLSKVGSVNQLWAICCLLSNYQGPLDIKADKPV